MSREKCILVEKSLAAPRPLPFRGANNSSFSLMCAAEGQLRKLVKNISLVLCFGAFPSICDGSSSPDAREIMQRSLAAVEKNSQAAHGYTFSSRVEKSEFDSGGRLKSKDIGSYDSVAIDGVIIQKLVAHNGRPLSSDEDRKENDRVRKLVDERKLETPQQKSKRLAELERQRVKEIAFNRELLDAFDFKLAGEEQIDGRLAWKVDATPRAGYQPHEMRTQMLPHFKGRVWIDRQDYCWSKVDAEAIDSVTIGFFLLRMEKGAHLAFSQLRFDGGVWLPRNSSIKALIRVGLLKKINLDQDVSFSNQRKLPPGSNVVTARPDER